MLLNRACDAEAVILKSNSSVCLPAASASGPSHLTRSGQSCSQEHRLPLKQIETVSRQTGHRRSDHAFGAALGNRGCPRDGIRGVEHIGESPCGRPVIGRV